jgi:hypothetical protein
MRDHGLLSRVNWLWTLQDVQGHAPLDFFGNVLPMKSLMSWHDHERGMTVRVRVYTV